LVFYDVAHVEHQVKTSKNWQKKGVQHTKVLKTNSSKKRINILGALDRSLKRFTIMFSQANCTQEMAGLFLEQIKKTYRWCRKKIHLVIDGASYNTAYQTQHKACDLGIELKFLPKSSPNLNIIERFWKFFKKKVVNNKYYESFILFQQAVNDFFRNLDQYENELDSLLSLNFEIIKTG